MSTPRSVAGGRASAGSSRDTMLISRGFAMVSPESPPSSLVEQPHAAIPTIEDVVDHPSFDRPSGSWRETSLNRPAPNLNISNVPFLRPAQQRVVPAHPVVLEAGPSVVPGVGDHGRAQGVGLDVPQHHQEVLVVLDHRAPESALPDMSRGTVAPVILPRVSHSQRLENPADRLTGIGLQEEMEMVAHQAIAQQPEGVAATSPAQRLEEGVAVAVVGEDVVPVVAPVQRMIDQSVVDGAGKSSHAWTLPQ